MIELMIVVALLGLLVALLSDSYGRWSRKYAVENAAKTMHSYLMDARSRAMTQYRSVFFTVSGSTYRIVEDTAPAPDGNDSPADPGDRVAYTGSTAPYTISASVTGGMPLRFDRDGTASGSGFIRIDPAPETIAADYDCVEIRPTRIRMGRFDGTTCQAR